MNYDNGFILTTVYLILFISKYPMNYKLYPIVNMVGRFNYLYQILAHFIFSYQLLNSKHNDTIYGGTDNQLIQTFIIASSIDYFGWITLASNKKYDLPYGVLSVHLEFFHNFSTHCAE